MIILFKIIQIINKNKNIFIFLNELILFIHVFFI